MTTTEYNDFINCENIEKNENDDINISIKLLFLSIPSIILIVFLIGLVRYPYIKPFVGV